ncbi:MAG: hypothetical protein JWM42_752 [Burkholderia sp.]|nr:hypothetical protein [Burkholderia sp.]
MSGSVAISLVFAGLFSFQSPEEARKNIIPVQRNEVCCLQPNGSFVLTFQYNCTHVLKGIPVLMDRCRR